ncbi:MAG: gliding motility-associated C-terminal domain-containing protein [Bacteroidota bacterium]
MKKIYLLLLAITFHLCCGSSAYAQLVGINVYLQGKYVEIGVTNNGSLGACNSATYGSIPTGYHPHLPGTGALAEVYDYGHDGWTVGAPPFMGDYTYPGSPFEGWGIQVNGVRGQGYQTCPGTITCNAGWLTGSNTGYSNVGGRAIGVWSGSAVTGGLQIRQETRVDTLSSWVVFTVTLKNTTGAAMNNVYYWRSCDPDNDQSWPGGAFSTNNLIVYQNDIQHRVLVRAIGQLGPNAYLGLGTKDCRARCCVYSSWGLACTQDLAAVWSGTYATGTSLYLPGQTNTNDVGVGLTYNIGNIPANDSAIISYAYIFSNNAGLDSAFPEPQMVVNGSPLPPFPSPGVRRDTFNACGIGPFPVDLLYGSDKSWSWSKWTWTGPVGGISATTGTSVIINPMAIPNYTTYTVTGTDSSTGMYSCNTKTFLLTIITCGIYASTNSPCEGDSLKMVCHGDSTGATYVWYGPFPSTTVLGTGQKLNQYPATTAMSGVYTVVRIVGTDLDTATINVLVNPKPLIGGVLAVCPGGTTTLTGTPGGGTWTGGSATIGTISATGVVTGVSPGTTIVTYRSPAGCVDTAIVNVYTPVPITGTLIICQGRTTTLANPTAGGSWSSSNPAIATIVPTTGVATGVSGGNATITYSTGGGCFVVAELTVNPTPAPILGTTGICQYFTTALSDASPSGVWTSSNPAIGTISGAGVVYGLTPGTTTIQYTLPTTCYIQQLITVHPKPAPPALSPDRYCQYAIPVPVSVTTGINLTWYGPGVTVPMTTAPTPVTTTPGTTNYYVTQTTSFGCISDSATKPVIIIAQPAPPVTRDTMFCQHANAPALTAIGSALKWYTATGTLLTAPPVPPTTYVGTTTWFVTQSEPVLGCESNKAPLNVTIIYKPEFTITATNTKVCQHDTLTFSYNGPVLVSPNFQWTLPVGAVPVYGTSIYDQTITVRFDTAWGTHVVYLTATNMAGMCSTTMPIDIKVIPQPAGYAHIKADLCIDDTITLALSERTYNATDFTWQIDGDPLMTSPLVTIISASSHSGGPYRIRFNTIGRHVITVKSFADNKCPSKPTSDSINVHALPDAAFSYKSIRQTICLEDSVWFDARTHADNWMYTWTPEHYFHNTNDAALWGRVEQARSIVMLTVTDPFGCKATTKQEINPDYCCTVTMPSAFTPNGDGKNDRYKPLFTGYKRFHMFRITNRWGQTIFESTTNEPYWDGTYNGVPQDMGVYFYYIKYDCGGKIIETKGDCTLVR